MKFFNLKNLAQASLPTTASALVAKSLHADYSDKMMQEKYDNDEKRSGFYKVQVGVSKKLETRSVPYFGCVREYVDKPVYRLENPETGENKDYSPPRFR